MVDGLIRDLMRTAPGLVVQRDRRPDAVEAFLAERLRSTQRGSVLQHFDPETRGAAVPETARLQPAEVWTLPSVILIQAARRRYAILPDSDRENRPKVSGQGN